VGTLLISAGCHSYGIAKVRQALCANFQIAGSVAQSEGVVDKQRPADFQQVSPNT
jgi:hypothetical protein